MKKEIEFEAFIDVSMNEESKLAVNKEDYIKIMGEEPKDYEENKNMPHLYDVGFEGLFGYDSRKVKIKLSLEIEDL